MDCWRVNGTLAVSRAIGKEAGGWETKASRLRPEGHPALKNSSIFC